MNSVPPEKRMKTQPGPLANLSNDELEDQITELAGKVLGAELQIKGSPNQAKIHPSFGTTTQDGHWAFLDVTLRRQP
jgi:hypothetical protein